MILYKNQEQISFDDILLVPQYSEIESRKSVNLSTSIGSGYSTVGLSVPVIAAPMDTVCEWNMAVAIRKSGGLGIIHRYMPIEERIKQVKYARANDIICGVAVGAKGDFEGDAFSLYAAGASVILVDTANGHSKYAIDAVKSLRQQLGNAIHIMAGNVSTYEGFMRLNDAGADSIRVGIGGGSVCTTRIVSGHGMPTLSSIVDIREKLPYGQGAAIIADGGIRNSGDAAKALAAGANAVMLGSYLAGTDESPGEIIVDHDFNKVKEFRGMASKAAQEDGNGKASVVEGVSTTVPYKGHIKDIIEEFAGGLGSALSYTGVDNLKDFYENSMFIKSSYASTHESKPHAINV